MTLLNYLNKLSRNEQHELAQRCGTTVGYLRKAVSVRQQLGAELCTQLELASSGQVTRRDLRPDDWHRIWPELAGQSEQKAA